MEDDPGSKFKWDSGKIETLRHHEGSAAHQRSVQHKAAQKVPPGSAPAEKIIKQLNTKTFNRLEILFRNAHFLAKMGRPYTDFAPMSTLDKAKGLDVGTTYLNNNSGKVFTEKIGKVISEGIKEDLGEAKFMSVLCDGSTDSSVAENEIVYIRTCMQGVVKVNKT